MKYYFSVLDYFFPIGTYSSHDFYLLKLFNVTFNNAFSAVALPISGAHLSDYRVRVIDGEFELWSDSGESSLSVSLNLLMLQAFSYYPSLLFCTIFSSTN